jgi:beta-lactam-binding protein with PASTA domain
MPTRIFAITAPSEMVTLDDQGRGQISFTASNTGPKSMAGRVKLVPLGSTKEPWLSLEGEQERNFAKGEAQQFTVKIAPPRGTPTGKYPFRLNLISVDNPDDEFTEGPSVSFEVKQLAPAAPPPRKFPWWIVALACVLVLGAGIITWLLLPQKVAVPDLVGKPYQEAVNSLSAVNLKSTSKDAESTGTEKPGIVVSQNPKGGEPVAPGTMITVFVEPEPKMVTVPDLIGVPVEKVAAILQGKFQYQVNDQRVITGKVSSGAIADQSPAKNQRVSPGTKVILTVEALSVQVPNLLGKSVDDAFAELRSLQLVPNYRDGDFAGKLAVLLPVKWQSPQPGVRVAPGTTVTVNAVQ